MKKFPQRVAEIVCSRKGTDWCTTQNRSDRGPYRPAAVMLRCGPHTPTSASHLWTRGSPSWTTCRPGGCRHTPRLWVGTAGRRWWGANCRKRQETPEEETKQGSAVCRAFVHEQDVIDHQLWSDDTLLAAGFMFPNTFECPDTATVEQMLPADVLQQNLKLHVSKNGVEPYLEGITWSYFLFMHRAP